MLCIGMVHLLRAQSAYFPEKMIVTADHLSVYAAPQPAAKVIETLKKGAVMTTKGVHQKGELAEVNGQFAPWYAVTSPSGKNGYVFGADVTGDYNLHFEGEIVTGDLPELHWYGVFRRDSFSDELREVKVSVATAPSDFYGEMINVLKTDQRDTSKFLIATLEPLTEGYAGPLGITDSPGWFFDGELTPGAMLPVSAGQPDNDTIFGNTWYLVATGCAALKENFVEITGYQLQLMEMLPETNHLQDMTPWIACEPGLNPVVQLLWYGDIDHDKKPDLVIHDCPFEMGCRTSLFLSSKAIKGALTQKVCEHFWHGD